MSGPDPAAPVAGGGLAGHGEVVLAGSGLSLDDAAAIAAGRADPAPWAEFPDAAVTALRAGWNSPELAKS